MIKGCEIITECPNCGNLFTLDCPITPTNGGFKIHCTNINCGCGRTNNFNFINLIAKDYHKEEKKEVKEKKKGTTK